MSLRAFHLLFIALSVVLAAFFAAWATGQYRVEHQIGYAAAALASPGPMAAATSAGVEPSGISFTDPSGSVILNILLIGRRL